MFDMKFMKTRELTFDVTAFSFDDWVDNRPESNFPDLPSFDSADPSGSRDSTAAIKTALICGNVFLPPGKYLINGSITVPSNRLVLGAGIGRTSLVQTDQTRANVRLLVTSSENTRNIVIKGFTLDGGGENYHGNSTSPKDGEAEHRAGIFITNTFNALIEDVHIKNCHGDGLQLHSSQINHLGDVVIRSCSVDQGGRSGFSLTGYGGDRITWSRLVVTEGLKLPFAKQGAAIDVEPNVDGSKGSSLTFKNLILERPFQAGVKGVKDAPEKRWENIVVKYVNITINEDLVTTACQLLGFKKWKVENLEVKCATRPELGCTGLHIRRCGDGKANNISLEGGWAQDGRENWASGLAITECSGAKVSVVRARIRRFRGNGVLINSGGINSLIIKDSTISENGKFALEANLNGGRIKLENTCVKKSERGYGGILTSDGVLIGESLCD